MRKGEVILNGMVPPQNTEAEKNVLCSILMNSDAITEAATILTADDFYDHFHATIYKSCLNVYERGEGVDIVTLWADNRELNMKQLTDMQGQVPVYAMSNDALLPKVRLIKEMSIRRQAISTFSKVISGMYDDMTDCMDEIITAEHELVHMMSFLSKNRMSTLGEVISDTIEGIDQASKGIITEIILDTGIPSIDSIWQGIFAPDFIVIGAKGGEGKTTFALQICKNMAMAGNQMGYISLEMKNRQVGWKIISSDIDVQVVDIRSGRVSEDKWGQMVSLGSKYEKTPMYFYDTPRMSIIEFCNIARKMKAKFDIKGIVLDYLQLLSTDGVKERLTGLREQTAYKSRAIKELCLELNIAVIALSQLTRREKGVKRLHEISDLKESSTLETDADGVVMICRPFIHGITEMDGYNNNNSFEQNDVIIQQLKWRLNDKKDVMLKFDGANNKFVEIDKTPFKQLEITDWNIYKRPKEIEFIDDAEIDSNLPVPF